MARNPFLLLLIMGMILLPLTAQGAGVEWQEIQTLATETEPLDVALSGDGKYSFILTRGGRIIVQANDGSLREVIQVADTVEGIAVSPGGEALFLQDRKNNKVVVISIDFIRDIESSGTPFKGRAEAPVTLAVFSDFQ